MKKRIVFYQGGHDGDPFDDGWYYGVSSYYSVGTSPSHSAPSGPFKTEADAFVDYIKIRFPDMGVVIVQKTARVTP